MDIQALPDRFLSGLRSFRDQYNSAADDGNRANLMSHNWHVYKADHLENFSAGILTTDLALNKDPKLFKEFMESLDIILRLKLPEPIGYLFRLHADERAKALSAMVYKLGSAVVAFMEQFPDHLTQALNQIKNFRPESIVGIEFNFDSCESCDDLPEAIRKEVDFKQLLAASINNIRDEMAEVRDTKKGDDRKIKAEEVLDDSLHRFLPSGEDQRIYLPLNYNYKPRR